MKIEKKEIDKLKQLDRIEFRQKLELIEINCHAMQLIILSLLVQIGNFLINSFIIFLIGWVFLGLAIKEILKRNKRKKELIEEYFKIGVK